ncbi:MAG: nicotinate phosphoribosyltransferase [Candidatus Brocadiae bacterium]|nr:nicotinate phosphoribosyltransferase [Candidatus Brocadiia bacterium]
MGLTQHGRALSTDLYELTMAAAYFELGLTERAAFELFVREMPRHRSYLVCAGLEQAVSYLQNLRFSGEQIGYLRQLPVFKRIGGEFFDYLGDLSFTGKLEAVAEGTPLFAGEPFLRVEAPIIESQIVETFLLSMVTYQTLVASKAARVVQAACLDGKERAVMDFGSRRAHGPDAGTLAARASYIGGCVATSNAEAGRRMGIPVSGTEAHSFIMAFDSEEEAFRGYYRLYGDQSVLLIDTYDVLEGAKRAIRAAPGMRGVRIDSGDVTELSKQVRRLLDEAGLENVTIVASGDLDEYAIEKLIKDGAALDGFGVGTRMVTSEDAPFLGGVYKLVSIEKDGRWEPCIKLSPDKATYPGPKQVHRYSDAATGMLTRDVIAGAEEQCPREAEALLNTIMLDGAPVADMRSLEQIRQYAARQLHRLPEKHRRLSSPEPYPVEISPALRDKFASAARELERKKL